MGRDECKKESNFCTHFIGDIFNTEHINKCYKYCSCYETEDLMQNDKAEKREDSTLKQKVKKKYSIMVMTT
jgi:hypothetical protein